MMLGAPYLATLWIMIDFIQQPAGPGCRDSIALFPGLHEDSRHAEQVGEHGLAYTDHVARGTDGFSAVLGRGVRYLDSPNRVFRCKRDACLQGVGKFLQVGENGFAHGFCRSAGCPSRFQPFRWFSHKQDKLVFGKLRIAM
jgi:hypothetical protein